MFAVTVNANANKIFVSYTSGFWHGNHKVRDVGPGRTALASVASELTATVDAVISASARSRLERCSYLIELTHTNHVVLLFELLGAAFPKSIVSLS